MTLFLLFCTVYMGINATLNVTKCISYNIKIAKLQKLNAIAQQKKLQLESEIESYKFEDKYKYFATRYLGYVDPNTIKVILVKNSSRPEQDEDLKPKFESFAY